MGLPEHTFGVWLHRTFVGVLRQRGDHSRFTLHASYAEDESRPVLGLVFEQDLTRVHSAAMVLPPWFSNLLPEGVLRRWIADQRQVSERREMELLAEVGHDLPGAVTVLPMPSDLVPGSSEDPPEPPPRAEVGSRPERDTRGRFSLAGVQLKLSMIAAGDRLVVPLGGSRGDWIVKFPDAAIPALPVVEFATMSLAKATGIDVPDIRLLERDELPDAPGSLWAPGLETRAFAIERFDRGPDRTSVHIEDFAQVRNVSPDHKYAGSFETLAGLVYRGVDEASLLEFVRRLAFNLVVDNADAHLKNWSLRYADPRRPVLSPAYDLVSLAPFSGYGGATGLRLGRTRRADQVRYAAFDRIGDLVGWSDLRLSEVAHHTVGQALAAWPAVAEQTLADHDDARAAITQVMAARSASLGR